MLLTLNKSKDLANNKKFTVNTCKLFYLFIYPFRKYLFIL